MTTVKSNKNQLDFILEQMSRLTLRAINIMSASSNTEVLSPEESSILERDYLSISDHLQGCSNWVLNERYNFRNLKDSNLEGFVAPPGEEWVTITHTARFFKEYWGLTPEDIANNNFMPKWEKNDADKA